MSVEKMTPDYFDVTELSGEKVPREQIERLYHRYYWAGTHCYGKDVLEVACGNGQGVGYLAGIAKSIIAGDCSEKILARAAAHYGDRFEFIRLDAQQLPFADRSFDVVILFEAIYYIPEVERFLDECNRVLRRNGKILIATANKDLYDFNPSPYSYKYYGIKELGSLLTSYQFDASFYGYVSMDGVSIREKMLRPVKKLAVWSNLIPKTMDGKRFLKRIVFGRLAVIPAEVKSGWRHYEEPERLNSEEANIRHKVIYCIAEKK